MRVLSMVFVLLLVVGLMTSAMAVPYSRALGANSWSLLSLPSIPTNSSPEAMFDANKVTAIKMFNNPTSSMVSIDWDDSAAFGGMLLTTGYWVYANSATTMAYEAVSTETMDMWISLPKAGWHLIGNPYSHGVTWANVGVTNGETTKSLADAVAADWLIEQGKIFVGTSIRYVGPNDDYDYVDWPAGCGMWVYTKTNNVALIINSDNTEVVPAP